MTIKETGWPKTIPYTRNPELGVFGDSGSLVANQFHRKLRTSYLGFSNLWDKVSKNALFLELLDLVVEFALPLFYYRGKVRKVRKLKSCQRWDSKRVPSLGLTPFIWSFINRS